MNGELEHQHAVQHFIVGPRRVAVAERPAVSSRVDDSAIVDGVSARDADGHVIAPLAAAAFRVLYRADGLTRRSRAVGTNEAMLPPILRMQTLRHSHADVHNTAGQISWCRFDASLPAASVPCGAIDRVLALYEGQYDNLNSA